MKGLPTIIDKSKNAETNSEGYLYTNIANSPIGTEFYFKIIKYQKIEEDLKLDFKFSNENFYEDYTNMNSASPNYTSKDTYSIYFYNLIKGNNANYLLLHLSNDYNFHIIFSEIEKDEYQKIIRKRILMATLIPIGVVIFVGVIVTIVIIYLRKKRRTESLLNNLVEDKNNNNNRDAVPLSMNSESNVIN